MDNRITIHVNPKDKKLYNWVFGHDPVELRIELDNHKIEYERGENVSGAVLLENYDVVDVKEITLDLEGDEQVKWCRQPESYRSSVCDGDTSILYSLDLHTELTMLDPGTHKYPFNFSLGSGLPSSFELDPPIEGLIAYIRYTLKAVVHLGHDVQDVSKEIKIANIPLDLSYNADAVKTSEKEERDFDSVQGCLFCKTKPVEATLRLAGLGYVPGQNIAVSARIIDKSKRGITKTEATLCKITQFTFGTQTFTRRQTISGIAKCPIEPGGTYIYYNEPLPVPQTPTTGSPGTHLIDISYDVELNVYVKRRPKPLSCHIPVVIGTIPPCISMHSPTPDDWRT